MSSSWVPLSASAFFSGRSGRTNRLWQATTAISTMASTTATAISSFCCRVRRLGFFGFLGLLFFGVPPAGCFPFSLSTVSLSFQCVPRLNGGVVHRVSHF
ncbi:putative protein conserved in bacteria, partial [Dysosmobacter welbionis]